MRRCSLCGETKRFKPGGFADICRGCNRAFGPFGGIELGREPSIWSWLPIVLAILIYVALFLSQAK